MKPKSKFLSRLPFILSMYFILSVIIIHILRKDLLFLYFPLSRYAIGPFSWIAVAGFLCSGSAELIFAVYISSKINHIYDYPMAGCPGLQAF